MRRFHLVLMGLALLGAACGIEEPSQAPLPSGFEIDLPMPEQTTLSKAETETERQKTKTDQFDVRGNFADIFGISSPPESAVRPVAEFENTEAVLIAWEAGIGRFLLNLIAEVSQASDVWIITWDLATTNAIRARLSSEGVNPERLRFFEFPHESFWTRDYGPISVVDNEGKTTFIDPRYYPQRRRDDAVPTLMSRYFGVDVARPNLATEGGNFMTNGAGICVVTEWLLQENPGLDGREIQTVQTRFFGCKQTLVLERLEREGTGHIDMFAKFLSENTILVGEYDELDPQNAALLDRNVERLRRFAEENDWDLNIVRIPMPVGRNGVYRSYTNSLIVNDTVIVPTYRGDRRYESRALEIYRNSMPAGYKIVAIDSEDAIQLGGAVHCTTMGFVTSLDGTVEMNLPALDAVEPPRSEESSDKAYESQPNVTIADDATTVDTLMVSDEGLAFSVEVSIDLVHEYLGDLVIRLERDGFGFTLLRNTGSSQTSLSRRFAIDVPRGVERAGQWRLIIEDTAPQDDGVLRSWSLRFDD